MATYDARCTAIIRKKEKEYANVGRYAVICCKRRIHIASRFPRIQLNEN
jgi:hypothetical protein